MKSHTVPKKLLEQFAFDEPRTRSKRLWRYQKGLPPYGKAAPISATRWDGHFADPADPDKEAQLEKQLEQRFEHPVNQLIDVIGYRTFPWRPRDIRALTGYFTMLFTRSRARRSASKGEADLAIGALRSVLSDDQALSEIVAKFTLDAINAGLDYSMVAKEQVAEEIENAITRHSDPDEAQRRYIHAVETMMNFAEENLLNGEWRVFHSEPDTPFVIGDAPAVTWERTEQGELIFGQGLARPNVEAFLPVSPTTCLHLLPQVARTRQVRRPRTVEINRAQAAFATEHCFANVCSKELDEMLQPWFGTMRVGIDGFSIAHIDQKKLFVDLLMGRAQPPALAMR
ncbi:MAG TPA: DUF4238 domain-containing protein [Bryobacteraceae bacterium]|jgi:hypothetical protein